MISWRSGDREGFQMSSLTLLPLPNVYEFELRSC